LPPLLTVIMANGGTGVRKAGAHRPLTAARNFEFS